MFSIGQKVVLVDDKWPETVKQLYLQLPVVDTIYVVRAVRVGVRADELIMDMRRVLEQSILLTGIYNPTTHRAAAEGLGSVTGDMRAALERRPTPVSNPPVESYRRHDQN